MAEMDMFSYNVSFDDIVIPFDEYSDFEVEVEVAPGMQPGGLEYDDSDTEEYTAFHARIALREIGIQVYLNP